MCWFVWRVTVIVGTVQKYDKPENIPIAYIWPTMVTLCLLCIGPLP